jgi:hypothetical protein
MPGRWAADETDRRLGARCPSRASRRMGAQNILGGKTESTASRVKVDGSGGQPRPERLLASTATSLTTLAWPLWRRRSASPRSPSHPGTASDRLEGPCSSSPRSHSTPRPTSRPTRGRACCGGSLARPVTSSPRTASSSSSRPAVVMLSCAQLYLEHATSVRLSPHRDRRGREAGPVIARDHDGTARGSTGPYRSTAARRLLRTGRNELRVAGRPRHRRHLAAHRLTFAAQPRRCHHQCHCGSIACSDSLRSWATFGSLVSARRIAAMNHGASSGTSSR